MAGATDGKSNAPWWNYRFGLHDRDAATLEDVGVELGVTREAGQADSN